MFSIETSLWCVLLFSETNRRTRFQIYSCRKLWMFRVFPLPIIRS